MKKYVFVILAVAVLGAGAVTINSYQKKETKKSETAAKQTFAAREACSILTIEDAKKSLGAEAKVADISLPSASSDDIQVSQCLYEQPAGDSIESAKTQKQASLLVRAAKTNSGADSNKSVFTGANKPVGVQEVSGYGNGSFWNPELGQLNIIKNDNWYIISVGTSNPADKKLEDSLNLANSIMGKL